MMVLIALGLYFFAGAWGVFLLWCLALVFIVPQGVAAIAMAFGAKEELEKGRRLAAAGLFAFALLWGVLWIAGVGYGGYQAYRAYLAIP